MTANRKQTNERADDATARLISRAAHEREGERGYTLVGGLFGTRHFGPNDRNGGTTSLGIWHQHGSFMAVDGSDRT